MFTRDREPGSSIAAGARLRETFSPRPRDGRGPPETLLVGSPADPLEREADDIAHRLIGALPPAPAQVPPAGSGIAPPIVHQALRSPGEPMEPCTRALVEGCLGADLRDVRIHTDALGAASAQAVGALAYTWERHIVFAPGSYAPRTPAGLRLLLHEAVHVLQNRRIQDGAAAFLRRTCPPGWRSTVSTDHGRALDMLDRALTKLSAYDGTRPPEVRIALARHFHASSAALARWIWLNLGALRRMAPLASYTCSDQGTGLCGQNTYAWTMWCVPLTDIRLCHPNYFNAGDTERSTTLIHEWVHRYGCNFDLGYEGSSEYSDGSTGRALFNADPWANVVRDVQ